MRLVALNAERAAEETRGLVRWLRPDFQAKDTTIGTTVGGDTDDEGESATVAAAGKLAWPKTLPEQVQAVRGAIATTPGAITASQLARLFQRVQTKKLSELLETLAALSQVRRLDDDSYIAL